MAMTVTDSSCSAESSITVTTIDVHWVSSATFCIFEYLLTKSTDWWPLCRKPDWRWLRLCPSEWAWTSRCNPSGKARVWMSCFFHHDKDGGFGVQGCHPHLCYPRERFFGSPFVLKLTRNNSFFRKRGENRRFALLPWVTTLRSDSMHLTYLSKKSAPNIILIPSACATPNRTGLT